ncbi:tRNA (guanosine(37)-N1)-methyltransferase TrmD [Candidatus Dependentiae bacterium]|nr:tRNA (guanosine(37)-N1)-methyltransferase TrmD [Candidatus Dependentiae bacterium]
MIISIITVFPELYEQFLNTSLIKRAQEKRIISFNLVKLSDLCQPKERIDEPVCGPGTGMIIKPNLIDKAIEACEKQYGPGYKIFFSPQGEKLSQKLLQKKAQLFLKEQSSHDSQTNSQDHLVLVCSRYEGIDERVTTFYADETISIGDYILMGGDLPAQVFLEGFLRLIPDVVGKEASIEDESFSGPLLDYPEYGLPKVWNNLEIPEIVLSGNHAAIDQWRRDQACKKTVLERFDWFRSSEPSQEIIQNCAKSIPPHYVAIMHTDIVIKGDRVGHSSVTSLDLHDTARSCATYGIKNMFMVSPLKDQQSIMRDLLDFWMSDEGKSYNLSRHTAVSHVVPTDSLAQTIEFIEKREGKKPLVITTSAKQHDHPKVIDYFSQKTVWKQGRPVLFIFGTGQGLADHIIDKSDLLLVPIKGLTGYKHLSVRSAIAIILDRWLGLNPKKK